MASDEYLQQKIETKPGCPFALKFKMGVGDRVNDQFCCRFDNEDKFVATGCQDGITRVFSILSGKLTSVLVPTWAGDQARMPVTSLRWKPGENKHVLLAVSADGMISYWHSTSSKCIYSMKDPNESDLYSVDYDCLGQTFCTSGKDFKIKIYDESTKTLIETMKPGPTSPGHSNRVFCVKCHPTDPNIIFSGGWDSTLQIWDVRQEHTVGYIFGPHICGESIDLNGDILLTGSYAHDNVLQLWSMRQRSLIQTVPDAGSFLYCAQFSSQGDYVLTGGAQRNETRIYNGNNFKYLGGILGMPRAVTGVHFSSKSDMFAFSSGEGLLRVFRMVDFTKE